MVAEAIERQLRRVPQGPGVYLFRGERGDVLYVGKAKSLRPRVRSYFQAGSSDTRPGIRQMSGRVETIETIVTQTEVEALHLEQNLVKRHRPPFNVRLRDDKSFPYIAVTVEDDYPRVMFTRERHRRLEQQMRDAAAEERFEDAARYRNRLRAIERLSERQAVERKSIGTIDVIGVAVSPERAAVQVFPLRDGRMVDRYSFHLENAAGEEVHEVLEQFCLEYYGSAPSIPPQILVPHGVGDTSALGEFLSERRGSRVEVRVPERGEKRRLQELAQQNATLALESETFVSETKRARRVEALEELREALNLESLPIRIECFDISNLQGREVVGSMVVFEDAVAKRSHYRRFTLRGVEGQDDFASMREVISRRFSRLAADPGSDEWNESFAATPNLVVIDGGKGQLSAALAAMHELDLPRVAAIALAKRIEEVFVPGRADPILLSEHSPGL